MTDLEQSVVQQKDERQHVSVENLTKVYGEGDDEVVALKDINLDINEGEFVSIVGESGCGKTTLLHTIIGLLEPTEGRVTIDGIDMHNEAFDPNMVGIVFQKPVLLDWRTVLKNVNLPIEIMGKNGDLEKPASHYKERAEELLDLVGLGNFQQSYPQELSGGMQQRASICRSLVYDPTVLAMDEPFGALDAFTRQNLNNELLRIWRETKKTILFVTHNLEEAIYLSDRVVVLSSRPGSVMDTIEVDLERPRSQSIRQTDEYTDLVGTAYEYFER